MPPRTNAKKVKARAKAKAKAKAKVQAEADENKPTFDVPEKGTSFDALPEELQLKILRLALFEDADEDKSTRAKALSVERLKRPAVVPNRCEEEELNPIFESNFFTDRAGVNPVEVALDDPVNEHLLSRDDEEDFLVSQELYVPEGITRALTAVAAAARLATVSKGLRTLATDERLWAEPLETLAPLYGAGKKEPPHPFNAWETNKHIDPRHSDAWPSMPSFQKYEKLLSHVRRLCVDYVKGIKCWTDVYSCDCTDHARNAWESPLPGYVRTGKRFDNYWEEIFTDNVTFRVLYNLFGTGFRDGPTEPGFWALINYMNRDSACLLDRVMEDDDIELKFAEMCRDELVGQGYLRRAGAPEPDETPFLSKW